MRRVANPDNKIHMGAGRGLRKVVIACVISTLGKHLANEVAFVDILKDKLKRNDGSAELELISPDF